MGPSGRMSMASIVTLLQRACRKAPLSVARGLGIAMGSEGAKGMSAVVDPGTGP